MTLRRRLHADDPRAHEPSLATALSNNSLRLADVGRFEDGLVAVEEAR